MSGRKLMTSVVVCVGAALVITGSRGGIGHTESDTFGDAHARLDSVLESIDARVTRIEFTTGDSVGPEDPMISADHLRERSQRIAAALDSLDDAPESERLGALAGLRASVADLEYRVDLAELAHADGIAGTDSLLNAWLHEADRRLDEAERLIVDSAAAAGYIEPLRIARDEYGRLESLLASIREQDDHEMAPLRTLGQELAAARRQVRATVRAMPGRIAVVPSHEAAGR